MLHFKAISPIQETPSSAALQVASEFQSAKQPVATKFSQPDGKLDVVYSILKRLLDISVSFAALLVLAPFLLLVAALVRLDSKGPALFLQQRNGLHGKRFTIYKFRTMRVMESGDSARQACADDPRISRLGCKLRKLSIDELPQLVNVLKGDMSLVGPRPHPPALDAKFVSQIPGYMDRYSVKPGLTGLAQVEGARGETSTLACMQKRVKLDRQYINKASFALDCWIIAKTALVLLFKPNGG